MSRQPIIAGNWKMHLTKRRAAALARGVAAAQGQADGRRCMVFPAFVHLEIVRRNLKGSNVQVGAQNCHEKKEGAFTGEISVPMLRDLGVDLLLLGHSERRHVFGETDPRVAAKVAAALAHGMAVLLCVGETLEERENERTFEVLQRQIQAAGAPVRAEHDGRFSVAYEPVWAIGTGRTATPHVAQEAHAEVRRLLAAILGAEMAARTPVLYGGSVKPDNAAALLAQPDVDGLLVGGASIDIDSFRSILAAAPAA